MNTPKLEPASIRHFSEAVNNHRERLKGNFLTDKQKVDGERSCSQADELLRILRAQTEKNLKLADSNATQSKIGEAFKKTDNLAALAKTAFELATSGRLETLDKLVTHAKNLTS